MVVVVLNDGETYSDISGCRIVDVGDRNPDEIEDLLGEIKFSEELYNYLVPAVVVTTFK